jgi:cation:H+ antiporter
VTVLLLALAFVLIVVGALGFTNAVEWLGQRLNLGAGAVGALLAAVGTALPESLIPVVALAGGGGEEAEQIAIGSIIGAPFLLGTLAMLLVAISSLAYRGRRPEGRRLTLEPSTAQRDLRFFLVAFPIGVLLGLGTPLALRGAAAAALVAGYLVYAIVTAKRSGDAGAEEELAPLHFDTTKEDPPSAAQIGLQLLVSLAAIVGGAEIFVGEVETVATSIGVGSLVLALVLAPLATELPEKINSVLWVRSGKDELALGNITGAMSFQSAIPVAIGLLLTDWQLDHFALTAALVALVGGLLAYFAIGRRDFGAHFAMAWTGLFGAFLAVVALG